MPKLIQKLSPQVARTRIDTGQAVLIDIREADEFARSHIPGACSYPLSRWEKADPPAGPETDLIFMCRSGMRTSGACDRLAALVPGRAFILDGGLNAWERAGLPVEHDEKAPLEIMRQVQIAAGSLILAGILMGLLLSPQWFGIAAFVGAGLIFAGVSGFCGMARLLMLMPWNRVQAG